VTKKLLPGEKWEMVADPNSPDPNSPSNDMQTKDQAKSNILELCSESDYGSWEFWSSQDKSEEECQNIIEAIKELVAEKKILPVEYKDIKNQSYQETRLDSTRLGREVRQSIMPNNIDPDNFYWFFATDGGKKEDLLSRRKDFLAGQ